MHGLGVTECETCQRWDDAPFTPLDSAMLQNTHPLLPLPLLLRVSHHRVNWDHVLETWEVSVVSGIWHLSECRRQMYDHHE